MVPSPAGDGAPSRRTEGRGAPQHQQRWSMPSSEGEPTRLPMAGADGSADSVGCAPWPAGTAALCCTGGSGAPRVQCRAGPLACGAPCGAVPPPPGGTVARPGRRPAQSARRLCRAGERPLHPPRLHAGARAPHVAPGAPAPASLPRAALCSVLSSPPPPRPCCLRVPASMSQFFDCIAHQLEPATVAANVERLTASATALFKPDSRHDSVREQEADSKRQAICLSHRFQSFAPEREHNVAKWYSDGHDYFWAVSEMLDNAQDFIAIMDWWLTPERTCSPFASAPAHFRLLFSNPMPSTLVPCRQSTSDARQLSFPTTASTVCFSARPRAVSRCAL